MERVSNRIVFLDPRVESQETSGPGADVFRRWGKGEGWAAPTSDSLIVPSTDSCRNEQISRPRQLLCFVY